MLGVCAGGSPQGRNSSPSRCVRRQDSCSQILVGWTNQVQEQGERAIVKFGSRVSKKLSSSGTGRARNGQVQGQGEQEIVKFRDRVSKKWSSSGIGSARNCQGQGQGEQEIVRFRDRVSKKL